MTFPTIPQTLSEIKAKHPDLPEEVLETFRQILETDRYKINLYNAINRNRIELKAA